MNDLNQERATLTRQLDAIAAKLPTLERLAAERERLGDIAPPDLRSADINLRAAHSEIESLGRQIDQIDRILAWREGVKTADATIRAASKEAAAAAKALAALGADHGKLASKLDRLRADTAATVAEAERAAELAAAEYASAATQGDDRAEAAAAAKLDQASETAEAAHRKAARQQPAITGLERELAAIEQRRAVERERQAEAERRIQDAEVLKAQAAWDAAAVDLRRVGERLAALEAAYGYSTLRKLYIPLHDRAGPDAITGRDLHAAVG